MKYLTRLVTALGVAALAIASFATAVHAQGVIVTGASSVRYVELRPLALDSVPLSQTDSAWGAYRQTKTGVLARCGTSNYCTFFRSADRAGFAGVMQDIDITAWGLGQGVSVHTQLRARSAAGDAADLWPQANQHFDAIAAYVDVERDFGHVRAGRQWIASTLGVFNFDGIDLALRRYSMFTAQLYGGSSLVEGLNRTLDADILSPVEDLPPTDRAYLVGGSIGFRPSARGSLAVQYQREIRADRDALYSERIGLTGDMVVRRATLSGQLLRDLATGTNNELSATVRGSLSRFLDASLTARHHAPYFDLWTIWGAFSPVGFNEFGGDLQWSIRDGRFGLSTAGAWRSYDDTHSGLAVAPMRDDGWHLSVGGSAQMTSTLRADAAYRADIGFGSSGANIDGALRWSPLSRASLSAHATAFQTVGEFQVGEGRVYGIGGQGAFDLTPAVRIVGDAFFYRHDARDRAQLVDWNQRRFNLRIEWSLGNEPTWGGTIGKVRDNLPRGGQP